MTETNPKTEQITEEPELVTASEPTEKTEKSKNLLQVRPN